MKRIMPLGWMIWIAAALASGAAAAPLPTPIPTPLPTTSTLDLSWCTVEASSCYQTTGSLRLLGVAGQPDVGMLTAPPVVLAGGFMLPGDPVLKLLMPANPVTWAIGEGVSVRCWADVPVTGARIRLELWRNQKKVTSFAAWSILNSATYQLLVPAVAEGTGYSVRMISEQLEAVGNPNPWVESDPLIRIVRRSTVTPRDWALYE